jgi:hypothetical protein
LLSFSRILYISKKQVLEYCDTWLEISYIFQYYI